jgi:hypothetical protein
MQQKLLTLLFAAGAVFAQTSSTATHTQSLPTFGLGSTETARITVVNLASATNGGTAASCVGSISFLSATGAVIGAATPFTIASNQIATASLPFASAGLSGNRGDLRASVSITRTAGVPCALSGSLATFETSSGATHLYLPDVVNISSALGRY